MYIFISPQTSEADYTVAGLFSASGSAPLPSSNTTALRPKHIMISNPATPTRTQQPRCHAPTYAPTTAWRSGPPPGSRESVSTTEFGFKLVISERYGDLTRISRKALLITTRKKNQRLGETRGRMIYTITDYCYAKNTTQGRRGANQGCHS